MRKIIIFIMTLCFITNNNVLAVSDVSALRPTASSGDSSSTEMREALPGGGAIPPGLAQLREDFLVFMEAELYRLMKDDIKELAALAEEYNRAKSTGNEVDMEELEAEINSIVDKINLFQKAKVENLDLVHEIPLLSDFVTRDDYQEYKDKAKAAILKAEVVPEFIFAGAASRMKAGQMYSLDLWELAAEQYPEIVPKQITTAANNIHLGMAQRQLIMYILRLIEIARAKGYDKGRIAKMLQDHKIITHINADIETECIDDFIANNFYGFNPDNVYFITQETYYGFDMNAEGEISLNEGSDSLPLGHGYSTMQMAWPFSSYTIDRAGNKTYFSEDLLTRLKPRFVHTHRINDLTSFAGTVVNIDKIAFGMYLIEQGHNIVVELVGNPGKQKGGNMVIDNATGKMFLLEESNYKGSEELTALVEGAAQMPYNAFRLLYKGEKLKPLLDETLPYNLRFKNGCFYLEAVTSDITQLESTNAVPFTMTGDVETNEVIHDCKKPKNLVEAADFMQSQDEILRQRIADVHAFLGTDVPLAKSIEPDELLTSDDTQSLIEQIETAA